MMLRPKYTYNTHGNMLRMLNISDNEKVFVRMDSETIRYQYDNHLGSACLELDEYGYIISYEEYHPFGTTSYRAGRSATEVSLKRYKYCGKERDEETGLYYYGARYYASWLGRFVSVDPLKEKYPSISPYVYCANNPIKYIDPDGRDIWISYGNNHDDRIRWQNNKLYNSDGTEYTGNHDFVLQTAKALNKIMEHGPSASIIDKFANNEKILNAQGVEDSYNITIGKSLKTEAGISTFKDNGISVIGKNQNISFNPTLGLSFDDGTNIASLAPFVALFHEVGHVYNAISDLTASETRRTTPKVDWRNEEEYYNIQTFERSLAQHFGMLERNTYNVNIKEIKTEGVLSKDAAIQMKKRELEPMQVNPPIHRKNTN